MVPKSSTRRRDGPVGRDHHESNDVLDLGAGLVGDRGPELRMRDAWSFARDRSQPVGLRVGHAIGSASVLMSCASVAVEIMS